MTYPQRCDDSTGSDRARLVISSCHPKGQATLISHAILVGLSILLVLAVITTFTTIRKDYQRFVVDNELEQTCFVLRQAMERAYRSGYESAANTTYATIRVELAERIADTNYRTRFANETLFIETRPPINASFPCKIGLNASLSGTVSGGVVDVSYTEYANGTKTIALERVF